MWRNRSLRVSEVLEALQNIPKAQLYFETTEKESDCNIVRQVIDSSSDDGTHCDSDEKCMLF